MIRMCLNAMIGSLVRTTLDEVGIVIRTNADDPLHPVIARVDEALETALGDIDTSEREASGAYRRHIRETLAPRTQLTLAVLGTDADRSRN